MNRQILRSFTLLTKYRTCPTNCLLSYYRTQSLNGGLNTTQSKCLTQFYRFSSSNKADEKAVSVRQKFKKLVAEYGTTVIVFHVTISLISLGTCYLLIANGVDVAKYMQLMGFSEEMTSKFVASAGIFVAAYAVHKVFAPVRLSITAVSVPFIVRYLRNKGFLQKK